MSAKKSIFVTAAMTAMLVVIMICLFALGYKLAFFTIGGIFFAIGLIATAATLCCWLEDDLHPIVVNKIDKAPEETVEAEEVKECST